MKNQTVGHQFVYGRKGTGSNFKSVVLEDKTLAYTYRSILAVNLGEVIVMSNSIANYSASSQQHGYYIRNAIPGNIAFIELEKEAIYENSTIESLLNEKTFETRIETLKNLIRLQKRARVADYTLSFNNILKQLENMVKFGDINKKGSVYKAYKKLVKDLNVEDLTEKARKNAEKQRAKLIGKALERKKERIKTFLGGDFGYSDDVAGREFLKVKEDKLLTSASVTVPLSAVLVLYKAYKNGKNVVGRVLGSFTILSTNEKEVQIGCHCILAKELDRVLGGYCG